MELLLRGGADALARNFAGLQPHKLASPGSPAWEQLLAHLEWRSCLDEPPPLPLSAFRSVLSVSCLHYFSGECSPDPWCQCLHVHVQPSTLGNCNHVRGLS